MTDQTNQTDVDPHDPDDASVTEVAIALAITEALAHPPDIRTMTAARAESIMESAVGITLRFYAHRVLQSFVTSWKPGSAVDDYEYRVMQGAVDRGIRTAIDDTGESVRDIIRASRERTRAAMDAPPANLVPATDPGGRGTVIEQGLDHEAAAYDRLKVGMSSVSRLLTTRAREQSKWYFATELGATGKVWRTQRDSRVRTSHGDLEGHFTLIKEPFVTIRGSKLQRPGDPSAPLFETINCRCRVSYRMAAA